MNKFFRSTMTLAVLLVGATLAQAQNSKPVLVVSLPSYSDLMADIDFFGQLAGQPGASQMLEGMVQGFTQGQGLKGLDKTRPMGLMLSTDGSSFTPSAFIPVTSAKDLVNTLTALPVGIGPPQEEGGVLKLTAPNGDEVFVREQGGWAFTTATKDATLPDDPLKALAGLNPEYDVAVRVYLQNVPEEKRKEGVAQFKMIMEMAAAMQPRSAEDDPLSGLSRKNMEQQVKAIERLLNEADQITIGLKIDRQVKNMHLDFTFTAVPGTQLEQEMRQMADSRTNYAGFLLPEAAATIHFCGKNSADNIEQAVNTLEQLKAKAEQAIDNDANLPDDNARTQVKTVLRQFLDVAVATVKTGKSDGGAVLMLGPGTFQAALGGFVVDNKNLEPALKNLVELAKGEQEFNKVATVKFDLETYKDVRFHQVSVKLPDDADEDAKKVFGDSIDLYIGVGRDSAYAALGKGSLGLVKSVIDRSAAELNKAVPPFQMSIALGPIFKFASSVNPNDPQLMMVAQMFDAAKGKDHILLNAKIISNGITYRLMIEDGILRSFGQMSMMMGGGRRGAPPPQPVAVPGN